MNSSVRTVSHLSDGSIASKTSQDLASTGRQQTYMSSRRLDMERNLRSNMTMSASRHRSKVVYVRVADYLRGPDCSEFQRNLSQEYGEYLHFEYFSDLAGIARVNFSAEPVSSVIVGYVDRSWAKRFSQNESRYHNLTIYLVCNDRVEEEYPEIMKHYSNVMLKPVAGYPDTQELIRVQYELYSAEYINEVTEKRIRSKFFFKGGSNAVLNLYYEEQLGKMVAPYVNPISSSRRFRKTNFFRYRDLKELMMLAKGRKNIKRDHTRKMASTLNINDSVHSIPMGESRLDVGSNVPIESVGDILRTSESEDVNYILVTGAHPQLEQIRKYCMSERNTRMLLLDSEKSIRELKEQMNIFASSGSSSEESSDRDRIVMSERLLIMVHYEDEITRASIEIEENFNFHTELVLFVSAEQLATAIWRVHENENYYGLVILREDSYGEYQDVIEHTMGFGTPRQIDNLKVLLRSNRYDGDVFTQQYLEEVSPSKTYLTTPLMLADVSDHGALIHQIFEARNIFYHPARGIIGTKVNVYVRKNRNHLFEMLSDTINRNKRLALVGYEDRQQLEYFVQKTSKTECSLVVTDERELIEVMKVVKGVENVYVLLISAKERLSFDPQVLKTGLEEDINTFIKDIPDNQEDDDDCSYVESEWEEGDGIGVLRRPANKEDNAKIVTKPGRALLTVRIANNEQSKNSILFENRIRKHFKEEVNFRFYENTEEIRDMDKSEEPLQFLIVNDAYLEWTKRMATVEARQKFDIIYYTRQPLEPFRELISKQRYVRFKLVANRWRTIEQYIIGRASKHSKYQETFKVTASQRVHVVIAQRNRMVQETLTHLAIHQNNEIAKRCVYLFHEMEDTIDLQKRLQMMAKNELCFVVLDERGGQNREYEIGNLLYRYPGTFRQIIISSEEKRYAEHERTATVVYNEEEVAEYIAMFDFVDEDERILIKSHSGNAHDQQSAVRSTGERGSAILNKMEVLKSNSSDSKAQIVAAPVIVQKGPPAPNLQNRVSKAYVFETEANTFMSRPDEPNQPCPKPNIKSTVIPAVPSSKISSPPPVQQVSNSSSANSSQLSARPRLSVAPKPPLSNTSKRKPSQLSSVSNQPSRPSAAQSSRSASQIATKPTIAVYYMQGSPSIERIVEYICNNSAAAQVLNYPTKNLAGVQSSLDSITVDRSMLLVRGMRKDAELLSSFEAKYPQLRVYCNPLGEVLTELSVVFQLGWEYKLLTLPYCNPALPVDMLTAEKIHIMLPVDIFNQSGMQTQPNGSCLKIAYKNTPELCERVNFLPWSDYAIAVVRQEDLKQVWNLPFHNPQCRLVVLASKLTVREWFDWYGDVFWLFADDTHKSILAQISKLTADLTKLKQPATNKQKIAHMLHYTQDQQAVNTLELLPYRKRLYSSPADLKAKLEGSAPNELRYVLLADDSDVAIKPLSTIVFARTTNNWSGNVSNNIMRVPYNSISDIREFIEHHQLMNYPTPIEIVGYLPRDEFELLKLKDDYPAMQLNRAPESQEASIQSHASRVSSIGTQNMPLPLPANIQQVSPRVQRITAKVIESQTLPMSSQASAKQSLVIPSLPTPPVQSRISSQSGTNSRQQQPPVQPAVVLQPSSHASSRSRLSQPATNSLSSQNIDPPPAAQQSIYQLINQAISTSDRDREGLGIYYLCQWLPVQPDRFMKHVNMNELVESFQQHPDRLMIVFAEKEMLRRIPKNIKISDRVRLVAVTDEQCNEHLLWLRVADLEHVENHIQKTIDVITQTEPKNSTKSMGVGEESKQPFDIFIASRGVFSTEDSNRVLRPQLTSVGRIRYVDRSELLGKVAESFDCPLLIALDGNRKEDDPIQIVYDPKGASQSAFFQPNARVIRSPQQLKQFLIDNPGFKAPEQVPHNRKKILNTLDLKLSREPLRASQLQPAGSQVRVSSSKLDSRVSRRQNSQIEASPYERISQMPSVAEDAEMMWIEDVLSRFLPILNGDIMRAMLPANCGELRELLAKCLPTLILVKYIDIGYVDNYLSTHPNYPTVLLLADEFTTSAQSLQQRHQNLRVIQLGKRNAEHPSVTLNLETHEEVEYLLRRLLEQNALIDLADNKYSRAIPADNASKPGLLPISNPNQMVYIVYDSHRNKLVMDSVGRSAGSNTLFLPYRTKDEAFEHIKKLEVDDTTLVICNDDDIKEIERTPTRCQHLYYIRHISDRSKSTAGLGGANERVLFTGYTLTAISNFISKLLINSFKKVGRTARPPRNQRPQSVRIRSSEGRRLLSPNEEKRYRRHYAPSTFGTAARFEYYDDKYVPTEDSTHDRASSTDNRPFSPRENGRLQTPSLFRRLRGERIHDYSHMPSEYQ